MFGILWQANVLSTLQDTRLLSTSEIQNSIYFNMSDIPITGLGEAKSEGKEEKTEQIWFVT